MTSLNGRPEPAPDSSRQPEGQAATSKAQEMSSRRRFIRAGLITTPLVLTLASRPASALVGPSVGLSGNLSFFGEDNPPPQLAGRTPGYWKQPQHFWRWPGDCTPATVTGGKKDKGVDKGGSLFNDFFEDAFPGKTMLEVLNLQGNEGGLEALGRHTVAAFLNASAPDIFYRFGRWTVVNMFNDVYPGGDYEALKDLFEQENQRSES